jgi:hypothetical protein
MKTYYNYFIHGSGYVLGCVVILLFVFSQVRCRLALVKSCGCMYVRVYGILLSQDVNIRMYCFLYRVLLFLETGGLQSGLSPILLVVLPMPQLKTSVIFKPTRELVFMLVWWVVPLSWLSLGQFCSFISAFGRQRNFTTSHSVLS